MSAEIHKIEHIKADKLDALWPQCSGFIQAGLALGEGEIDLSQVRQLIVLGNAELIAGYSHDNAVLGAMVIQFINFANFRVANVLSIGGSSIVASSVHWAQIKTWLKQSGASKVQGFCKPAQARLWRRIGFTQRYAVVRAEL
jgi:hypothetical protein